MKRTSLVLSILLLFAGGVWGDYWDYDDCGHDQKPCLTKEGNLMDGRYDLSWSKKHRLLDVSDFDGNGKKDLLIGNYFISIFD